MHSYNLKNLMIKIFIPLLFLSACSWSHKENKIAEGVITDFTFGRFCGECRGNCAPMFEYKLNENIATLYADTSNQYFYSGIPKCEVRITNQEKFEISEALMKSIPPILLNYDEDEYTFGKPDDHDQCGYYLEFTQDGERKKFIIDPSAHDDVPIEVTQFAALLDEKVEELMK
jgi:hypothetical protein